MDEYVRDRVPAVTAVLTVVSLTLVIGTVRGFVPATALPRAPAVVVEAIPTINAAVSVAAIVAIVAGLRAIRRGDVSRHRRAMVAAFGLFVAFLVGYLYRIALVGPTHFPETAPGWVETYVYLPILAVHMGLAMVSIPLVYYVLLVAYSYPLDRLSETTHPRVGRVAAALWLVSFALGVVVYLMLYVLF